MQVHTEGVTLPVASRMTWKMTMPFRILLCGCFGGSQLITIYKNELKKKNLKNN